MRRVVFSAGVFGRFFPFWLLVQIILLEVALRSMASPLLDIISKATGGSDKSSVRGAGGS
jgi:hypothetical protein